MATEGRHVECVSCFDDDSSSTRRPSTGGSQTLKGPSAQVSPTNSRRTGSSSEDTEDGFQEQRPELQRTHSTRSQVIETPPGSPRVKALQSGSSNRRDSSFRKTYDENDKKRAIPCENCALTLPRRTGGGEEKMNSSEPILRTRKPYARVAIPTAEPSPPKSPTSEAGDSDTAAATKSRPHSQDGSSGASSFNSQSHKHYLDYTSAHEPLSSLSFSIIRQSCLRTLSCETLPPSTTPTPTSAPTSPFLSSPTSSSSLGSTSGGPIFFGDPLAGYTTAYLFRIPDPHARGRRRVYALMALSTHRERIAMQTFTFLSVAFREIAAWIQGLAEMELERSESASPRTGGGGSATSSFLSGRGRMGDGGGVMLKAKGLAELVGLPDFFLELHARFVRVLVEMGLLLGT